MRKVVGVLAGVASLAVLGALWLLPQHGASVAEQLAALRASGAWIPIEERCRGHVPGSRDLTLWSRELAAAYARAPLEELDLAPELDALEQSALDVWYAKGWAVDAASWTREAEYLARRADELAEVAIVFRSVSSYAPLDACTLYAGLVPPNHHPGTERMSPFEGLRALQISLVRAARDGELVHLQRDTEALLVCVERLRCPVNGLHFFLWVYHLSHALLALEGVLPLLGERLDGNEWAERLAALQPRALLLTALEVERAAGLRSFEWQEAQASSSRWGFLTALFARDAGRDLAAWSHGFDLGCAHLRGANGAEEALERFLDGLDERLIVSATLAPMFRELESTLRFAEARIGLALTALRLSQHDRAHWEEVPRELDPWTGAPLEVLALPGGQLRLRAVHAGAEPEDQRMLEWLVR